MGPDRQRDEGGRGLRFEVARLSEACRVVPGVPVPEPATAASNSPEIMWVPSAQLGEHHAVASAFDVFGATAGSRNAAVMAFLQGVVYAVVGPSVAGSVAAQVIPAPEPVGHRLGFDGGGFCARVAYEQLGVEAVEPGQFEGRVAESVLDVLTPVVERLHRSSGLGRRVLWSTVPDSIAAIGLAWAVEAAGSPGSLAAGTRRAWARVAALTDAIARRVPAMTARPRPFAPSGPNGAVTWMVRGGCCFVYRDTARYCVTCPVLDDDARGVRLAGWLRESGG